MQLSDIKGLGTKRIEKLASCGIYDPLDLLLLFPSKYFDKNRVIDWNNISNGESVIFYGKVSGKPMLRRIRKGLSLVKATIDVGSRNVSSTWFNQDYVIRRLSLPTPLIISGKVKRTGNYIEITGPQIIADREAEVLPIYRLPSGLTQTVMCDAAEYILSHLDIRGYIGKELADKYGLMPLGEAFSRVHFPKNLDEATVARKSIALENLAYTLSIYNIAKDNSHVGRTRFYRGDYSSLKPAISSLDFTLTEDQQSAVKEIISELSSKHKMNVLLQGDVGSGKTIVAFLAMYYCALSGYQSAIMAPTEILANQHHAKAKEFFSRLGLNVCLLTGSVDKSRADKLAAIENGSAQIIVGTHAILNGGVKFCDLGLTVTDEQHRFGVCQRGALENKAEQTDNIVMSATPIPRTLALSLYGQLKTVVISSRPSGKNNIMTAIVPQKKLEDMYGYILNKAKCGEKTYIVCPRVDSEDTVSAVSLYSQLSKTALKSVGIGLLHGRQKDADKNAAMQAFAQGRTMVLVSTTVIEVGIDVKEASTMVIFGAEYFGLSQLHQLRGRVGRDGKESYCFVVTDGEPSERLKFFRSCSDGFKLAEYDFEMRGAGDFLGTRQHGQGSDLADVRINAEMIGKARAISEELLSDPQVHKALSDNAEKSEFIKSLSLS